MRRDSSLKNTTQNRKALTDYLFQFVPLRHPVSPLGLNHVRESTEKELQRFQEPNPKHAALQLFLKSPVSPFVLLRIQIPLPLLPL
ncbi:unnamed protein product [Pleuronectes platessa]|uniref:Uncharacterized protein n=1 Tax=Pleuronectes platessa TaxID=8262 RepID=A0A9N7UV18_PLEPL|nr:unnamed protein product [Pleuronectes platessa]